jgi:hypothetical protein
MQEFFDFEINSNSSSSFNVAFSDSVTKKKVDVDFNSIKSLADETYSSFLMSFETLFFLAILGGIISRLIYKNYRRDRAFAWLQKVVAFERIFQAPENYKLMKYEGKANAVRYKK